MTKIEIDLDQVLFGDDEEGPLTLREQVMAMAVQRIVDDFKRTDVAQQIAKQVREVVHANIDATVRTALAQPIQPTTRWGERQGEAVTVLDMARERLEGLLSAPAARDRAYRTNEKPGNLAELIDDVVKKELTTGELRKTLDDAKKAVAAKVEKIMVEYVAQALTTVIKR